MSVERFRFLMSALFGVIIAITAITTIGAVYVMGPTIETRFFPVVGKLQILKMEAVNEGQTKIWAAFNKIRSCEYVGIAWFRGSRGGQFDRVPLQLLREPDDISSPNRPVGFQRSGPWIVSIPIEEIETNSFVELTHTCHPFWATITEFYP